MVEPSRVLPSRIGKYELVEFLGGAMPEVYRARDTVLAHDVSVRILTIADEDARARFLREARLASSILHENIVRVYDFGEDAGQPYMVLELLSGQDLRAAIQGGRLLDVKECLRIAADIATAIGHIHSQGIVHRDVKPDNIHLDTTGRVRLMDFGIARTAGDTLTQPGFTLGTPSSMAPEQVRGEPLTPLVDLYAFGILLYELFSRVKPFSGDDVAVIFRRILEEPVDPAPLENLGLPRELTALVLRLAAKDPQQRPQDFRRVAAELRSLLSQLASPADATTVVTQAHPSTDARVQGRPRPPLASFVGTVHPPQARPEGPSAGAGYLKPWIVAAAIVGLMLVLLMADLLFRFL